MSGKIGEYNLRPIWDAILDIYQEFSKLCDKHGLRYYATGGTALGAMRHGGFIPWDDDFDLVMPREDFRKFFDVIHKELPSYYVAEDFHCQKRRYYADGQFGKVLETRTEVIERVTHESNLNLSQGIFIDLIPIDGYPKSKIAFWCWFKQRSLWFRLLYYRPTKRFERFVYAICRRCFGIGGDLNKNLVKYEDWLRKRNYDTSPVVEDVNCSTKRLIARRMHSSDFGEARSVPFDRVRIKVPQNAEKFLEVIFGDWHKLPPEDKRHPSHQIAMK